MNILFIDDEREPTAAFCKAVGIPDEANILWVSTSADALRRLRSIDWDQIWFDHDLALVHGVEDTTMIVAQTLAELAFHEEIDPTTFATCVIHTQNPVGRDNLALVLNRWGFTVRHVYL